jgi:hypothetical protein
VDLKSQNLTPPTNMQSSKAKQQQQKRAAESTVGLMLLK